MSDYASARRDMEYLETIAELDDWITIEDEMLNLMRDPTKARAARLYVDAIECWFRENPDVEDEEVERIRAQYRVAAS